MSVNDKPKNDGSIVGIPESKEVAKTLTINTGGGTIDTPQKDAGGKRITLKAKRSGGSGTKRSISGTLQDGKESTPTPKRPKRKTNLPEFLALIRNNLRNIKRN